MGTSLTPEFWRQFAGLLVIAMAVAFVLSAVLDALYLRRQQRRAEQRSGTMTPGTTTPGTTTPAMAPPRPAPTTTGRPFVKG